ncbi:MAG: restriction endonuclease subunit S [Chloroflexi bacterium AL-W]|nr:restriction endonuclease subunit S [Chloroflexi bacterium AL-N1]NOK66384.1 restriction endonuclease subunit S [Chloroflexi bacterium AL-N10]NOK71772.1 restriction endonuclease subunit S [Chloroflexi bacterium AL-N5]NOK81029.1 restriction endonuclease subunit S [Chloroflexi bacterium AL-W]NOK89302.1 restriction endonuclease subunit S [Chloroflexi bacterium AL-N15]
MVSDWKCVTIDEVLRYYGGEIKTGPFGTVLKASEYSTDGVPLISVGEIGFGRIEISSTTPRVSKEVTNRLPEYILKEGDIVFGRKGAVERCARVTMDQEGWFLGSDGIRVRLPITCNSQFVLYQLLTKTHREWMHQQSNGTTMASLNQSIIKRIPLTLPPLHEQRAIAHVLGSLDDKIELNRRMNATLEELARAIFKSWFVDFDPVRAKAAGRQPVGMDDATAALFPDSFETVDGREVPRGWEITPIEKQVHIVGGGTPSTKESAYWDKGTICWATPKDLAKISSPFLLDTDRHITSLGLSQISSGLLPEGTVLLSSRAPIGYLAIAQVPTAINQGFIALVCENKLPNSYILLWSQENMDTIKSVANGTTFLEISKSNFRSIPIIVPSDEIIGQFVQQINPLLNNIVNNLEHSLTLATLRDSLLPKLLSGEIRVRDAEHWIETVS